MYKEAAEKIIDSLSKEKIATAVALYLISASILFVCVIMKMVPFNLLFSFMDDVQWNMNLNDKNLLVNFSFLSCVIYLIVYFLRKVIINVYQDKSNSELRLIYANIYTVEDIAEFCNSILILVCMLTVFNYIKLVFCLSL